MPETGLVAPERTLVAVRAIVPVTQMPPNSDALKRLYHDCDLFCLPSYGDCLPMVLSEAGAAGLPSVATSVGAIPEIVRDGETGLLVGTKEPAALAIAIEKLLADPALAKRMGATGRQVAIEKFAIEKTVSALKRLLVWRCRVKPPESACALDPSLGRPWWWRLFP